MVLVHEALDFAQLMGPDASASRQAHTTESEFTFTIGSTNMNVRWFRAFIRIEVKSVRTDAQNRGHCATCSSVGQRPGESVPAFAKAGLTGRAD